MQNAEERRRQRELEEARKAGLAAPEVDAEGNAINPHIPSFMADAPWYLNAEGPSLKHQKNWKQGSDQDQQKWYDRGAKVFQATKWRKGACENCGSMSHKTKDCMERPRNKGAKWTNKHIAADEKLEDINVTDFEAKRDRWNGYNPDEWVREAEKFEKVAAIRQEIRQKELLEEKFAGKLDQTAVDGELEKEEDKISDTEEEGFAKIERRVRSAGGGASGTVRNLRIREDTAKYLLNLDIDSAYYDPKSRSMRMDPNPNKDPSQKMFAGDNFVRSQGAVQGFNGLNVFSVTAYEKGQDIHLQATPSQAELAYQQFKARKEQLTGATKEDILSKYGNAAEKATDDILALKATEAYIEYDANGRVIRGQEVKARSRYEEDVYPGNHKSVWGSWWSDGQWGYACCRQSVKNSYCTGAQGQVAAGEAAALIQDNLEGRAADEEEKRQKDRETAAAAAAVEREGGGKKLESLKPAGAALWGTELDDEAVRLDPEKLKEAIKRQEAADREHAANNGNTDERKRGYNSLKAEVDVTAEDMEAYRLKRSRGDDPLAAINKAKEGQGGYDYV